MFHRPHRGVRLYLLLLKVQVEGVRDLLLDRELDRTFRADPHPRQHAHGLTMTTTTFDASVSQMSGMPSWPDPRPPRRRSLTTPTETVTTTGGFLHG